VSLSSVWTSGWCLISPCVSPQMNSLGNSSKWPSYDSLSSTSSHLLSESEQTEDEADVLSEGEGDSCIRKSLAGDNGITLFPALSDQLHSRSKGNGPERCPAETKRPDQASSHGAAALGSSSATPGDRTFAQKVSTLKLIPRSSFRHCRQPNIRSVVTDLSSYILSVQICGVLSVLCWNFYMD